ncbi:hypothetical protein G3580_03815 [Nitrogeniibacter mangrovi]|uniref:Nitrous oxide reductase accessory protein NosL n=1 Tax=Nitrogeniibacter mangrovi TaxID=2016596 RepID=A0A6C1AZU1_9RHOO|nr:nitrous oxide reductase accessory protein NosL [Nitrogeniibacter mangrovi]QID16837.1 hypothetical protein G3580_03815 [Nitrogeniibacter mangrovi]
MGTGAQRVSERRGRYLLALGAVVALGVWGVRQTGALSGVEASAPQSAVCHVASGLQIPAMPYDPASGRDRNAPRPLTEASRCSVCGMYVARHPRWAAQLIQADGGARFFDSPLDLVRYQATLGAAASVSTDAAVVRRYVTDYEGGGWVPAEAAFFVVDADVLGPMRGPDVPAFASEASARAFTQAHGGAVLRFDALVASLPAH